jgi:hypothetical protein
VQLEHSSVLLCRRRRRRRQQRDRLGTVLGWQSFTGGPTVPGCLAAAGNILLIGTSFADAGAEAAAEGAGSGGDYFLYQKLSSTGEHLKYGITKYPQRVTRPPN